MKSNEELRIFIVTHKIVEFYNHKNFFPILVGAEKNNLKLELKDNIGDNISLKNPNYCELTAMYWIWKNVKSEYVGICHYRRYFNEKKIKICEYKNINTGYITFNQNRIIEELEKYDLILPNIYNLKNTVKNHYRECHIERDLEELGKIIKEKYEESYFKNWDIILNDNYLYPYNMLICKKDRFDNYCKWLFDILFELEKRIEISSDSYQARVFGFLSERLMLLYVATNNLRVKEMNVTKLDLKKEVIKENIKNLIRPLLFWRK
jgi:hypothetical protein